MNLKLRCDHFCHLHCILTASDVQDSPRCPIYLFEGYLLMQATLSVRRRDFLNDRVAETAFVIYNQRRRLREPLNHVLDSTLRHFVEFTASF